MTKLEQYTDLAGKANNYTLRIDALDKAIARLPSESSITSEYISLNIMKAEYAYKLQEVRSLADDKFNILQEDQSSNEKYTLEFNSNGPNKIYKAKK